MSAIIRLVNHDTVDMQNHHFKDLKAQLEDGQIHADSILKFSTDTAFYAIPMRNVAYIEIVEDPS